MAIPRTVPVPVPPEELQRARDQLAPYGSLVWEDEHHRTLIVRVPGEQPDPVNHLEKAIDHISPGDARGITHVLLVADRRAEAVPPQPVRDLMSDRVAFDRRECARLRDELGPHDHFFYTATGDPRRLARLALRLPRTSVHGLEDEDLDAFTTTLGPRLAAGQAKGVRAVYLIADRDDVRLDPDLFLPDLQARWSDADRRRRLLEDTDRAERTHRVRKETEHQRLLRDLQRRFGENEGFDTERRGTVRAPLRRGPAPEATAAMPSPPAQRPARQDAPPARPTGPPAPEVPTRSLGPGYEVAPEPGALYDAVRHQQHEPGPEAAARGPAGLPPTWAAMQMRLETHGYRVMARPPAQGHRVDLAAERPGVHPERIIVRFPERLDQAEAQAMLGAAKDLGADLAMAVTEHADPEALRLLVATKGRWVAAHDVASIRL